MTAPQENPSREMVIAELLEALLENECGCVSVSSTNHDAESGMFTHSLQVEEAPRDWFFESKSLASVIEDALDAISHTDEPVWVAYFTHPDTPAELPFQNPNVLLQFSEPGDGGPEVVAIGNVAGGWCLVGESGLGAYTDDDADASGSVTLHLGQPEHIERVIAERATDAVTTAVGLVQALLQQLPASHQGRARHALAACVSALD